LVNSGNNRNKIKTKPSQVYWSSPDVSNISLLTTSFPFPHFNLFYLGPGEEEKHNEKKENRS